MLSIEKLKLLKLYSKASGSAPNYDLKTVFPERFSLERQLYNALKHATLETKQKFKYQGLVFTSNCFL